MIVPRIVLVDAGSVVFTQGLLADLFAFPELRTAHIALHDIDPERLATAEAAARHIAGRQGAAPTITAHADRRAALAGARLSPAFAAAPFGRKLPGCPGSALGAGRLVIPAVLSRSCAITSWPAISVRAVLWWKSTRCRRILPCSLATFRAAARWRLVRCRVRLGNVPGLIENLPARGTVEVPCLVDGSGVHPTRVGALPPQLASLNRAYLSMNELVVRAALEDEPRHIRHAAMVDPATSSTLRVEQIWQLCDEMVLAHAERLQPGLRTTLGT